MHHPPTKGVVQISEDKYNVMTSSLRELAGLGPGRGIVWLRRGSWTCINITHSGALQHHDSLSFPSPSFQSSSPPTPSLSVSEVASRVLSVLGLTSILSGR